MRRFAFPSQLVSVVGVILLLGLVAVQPAGAFPLVLQDPTLEPTPRDPPVALPFLQLDPTQGVAGDRTVVLATGLYWDPNAGPVTLYWDNTDNPLLQPDGSPAQATVGTDTSIRVSFVTPTEDPAAAPGIHIVIAIQGPSRAEAAFELIQGTPTHTPTATDTSTPTSTLTPVTPSATPSTTPTFTPSPTLRPVTPMVTITPIPPTARPPGQVATRTPAPTRTNTPQPGTSTFTPTPSVTPTPSDTPGPGTPSATPQPAATSQPTATPVEEISETGSGWGTVFLWGFVLAGLLVVFRLLRVRNLPGAH